MVAKKQFWTKLRTNITLITTGVLLLSGATAFYLSGEKTKMDNEATHKDIEQRIYY